MITVRAHSFMAMVLRASLAACFAALSPGVWAQTSGALPLPGDPNVLILEQLANPSDGHIDYAKVETAIEHMVNPSFDDAAFQAELNYQNTGQSRLFRSCPRYFAHGSRPTPMQEKQGSESTF